MNTLLLSLALIFVAANVITEYLRRRTDNWLQEPMSAYLTGPYSYIQDAGFLCLCVALALLSYLIAGPNGLWHIPLYVAAAALVGVVATKYAQLNKTGSVYQDWEDAHLVCAGIAFAGVTVAELYQSWGTPMAYFPIAAVAFATAFTLLKLSQTAILEKLYAALIVAWLIAYCR